MKPVWVIGAGGHAKVVIDAIRASGQFDLRGVLDDAAMSAGDTFQGVPILGPADPDAVRSAGVTAAIIAIGDNQVRRGIFSRLEHVVEWVVVQHPSAIVSSRATIGKGAFLAAGTVVQPDARIGAHTIVNTRASVDHDCDIGAFTHIAPAACLAGDVAVGEGTFVGAGATIIPGRQVGEWTTIGAGASVVHDLSANVTAVGVPAKVIKERQEGWHLG